MIRDEFVAFDDEIRGTTTYYTSENLQTRLAAYDKIAVAIDARSVNSTGSPAIAATLEHSGDGLRFVPKYINASQSLIFANWLASIGAGPAMGSDDGSYPGLPFMRIALQGSSAGGTFTSARVRVYVVLRDIGGGKPIAMQRGYR